MGSVISWMECSVAIVGEDLPGNAKKCRRCNNSDFYPELCSRESRIAYYFAALRQFGLRPLTQAVSTSSVRMLTYCILRHLGLCGIVMQVELTVQSNRWWKI